MAVKFSNNASTLLSTSVNATATSITVDDATNFPTLGAGDYTYVTIDADSVPASREVVKVTGISGNVFTIERGQDGTSGTDFDAGVKVELRLTAALLNDVADFDEDTLDSVTTRGATTTNDVTVAGATVDSLKFTGGTGTQGTLSWNTEDETIDLIVSPDVTYQLGQETGVVARNLSGQTLNNGAIVRVTGASGDKITVDLATANTELGSAPTIGVVTETISNNSTGRITTAGLVRGLDTSLLTEGAAIFLGADGAITTTAPTSPAHLVHIGWVVRAHATEGAILVHINNGWEIEELHDVLITNVADNELLQWNASSSVWENRTIAEAGLATAAQGTLADSALQSGDNISLLTNNSGYITGNQTITLSGDVSGSGTTSISVTIADDSHNHIISNVDGLQAALDGKVDDSQVLTNVPSGAVFTDTTYSIGNGGLTEINFTSALNSKLAGIEAGANNYTLPFTDNSTNWNTAYSWGNHASAGYLTSFTETDPTVPSHVKSITTTNVSNWNTAYSWGDHGSEGYLTSSSLTGYATESYVGTAIAAVIDSAPATLDTLNELAAALGDDPNFATTVSNSIGTKWTQDNTKISNWDTAYGWGNHASAGYAEASQLNDFLPLAGGTLTGELRIQGSSPQIKFSDTDQGDCWIHVNSNRFYILPDRDSSGSWDTPYALQLDWSNNTAEAFGNTIWTSGNDGSGSGLDADLLDGQQGSYYYPASNPNGYTNDQTPSEILTAIKTVDGSGSGLDADLLDGYHASNLLNDNSYLYRTDNRQISPSEYSAGRLAFGFTSWNNNSGAPYADFLHLRSYTDNSGGSDNLVMFKKDGIGLRVWQQTYGSATPYSSYADFWHSGNDGAGSGLDADLLDGVQGSQFLRSDEFDQGVGLRLTGSSYSSTYDTVTTPLVINQDQYTYFDTGTGYLRRIIGTSGTTIEIGQSGTAIIQQINLLPGTAGNNAVKVNGNTVWNAGNDGSGSGLDADLLDGQHASAFEPANATILHQGSDITSQDWNTYVDGTEASWNTVLNHSGANRPSSAYTYGTALSFAKSGQARFQLYAPETSSDGGTTAGLWYRTGWNTSYRPWVKIWDSGNDGSGSGLDADLLDGQQGSYYLNTSTNHGGDITGTYNNLQIAANVVGANELNVSGNGTSGQVLSSDGDGSMTWTTPSSGGVTTGKAIAMAIVFG